MMEGVMKGLKKKGRVIFVNGGRWRERRGGKGVVGNIIVMERACKGDKMYV